MSTAILSRIKALGYVPPFVAKSTMVMDAADILVLGTGNAEAATLLADALNEACREEGGQWVKCSERLPEGVFAKVRFVRLGRVHRGTFLRGNPPAYPSAFVDPLHQYWASPDLVGTSDEVTHWMPDDDPQPPTTQPKEERR